eukprot:m.452230 g.452230  ORF g.452230 m.452230 type:complete len:206 (+) comp56926_c0_seq5:205-822(+)
MQYLASCAWLQARSYSAPSLAGGVKVLTGRVVASVVSFAFLSGTFPLVLKSPVVASWRCCGQAMSQSCKTNSCLWRRWVRISDLSHEGTDLSAGEAESCPGERALGKCDHLAWLDVPLVRRLCRFGFASRRLAFEKVEANLPVTAGTENVSRLFLKALSLGQVRQQAAEVQSDANLKTLIELLHVAEVNRDILQAQGFDASLRPR